MKKAVRIAVMGAGLIGKAHIERVAREPEAELIAIIDPAPFAKTMAEEMNVPWYPGYDDFIRADRPDLMIVATPNQRHFEDGMRLVKDGIPMLMEKPVCDTVERGHELVSAAERAGVTICVGHHRRHSPLVRMAREVVESGQLGKISSVAGLCWFLKPDYYYDVQWRREIGAGPILLNLIHVIDDLRNLCGNVVSVQALQSNATRGFEVEDSAAILLRFENGALGTISISDAVNGPWSWELTAGENKAYPQTSEFCYLVGGTKGSLTVPRLDVWRHTKDDGWWCPIKQERVVAPEEDPLVWQIRNLIDVVRGEAKPVIDGREGLRTLETTMAVKRAAETGETVTVVN